MMKQIALCMLIFCGVKSLTAQSEKKGRIFYSHEFHVGNFIGFDGNCNFIYKDLVTLRIGVWAGFRRAENIPEDYSSGFSGLLAFGLSDPTTEFYNIQFSVGRIFILNRKRTIRLNPSIGVGLSIIEEPENYKPRNVFFLSKNYSWSNRTELASSLVFNPRLEFPLHRIVGFTFSPLLIINKYYIYTGFGLGFIVGSLRD